MQFEKTQLLERRLDLVSRGPAMQFLVDQVDAQLAALERRARAAAPVVTVSQVAVARPKGPARVSVLSADQRNRFRREAQDDVRDLRAQQQQAESALFRLQHDKQPFRVAELVQRAKQKIQALKQSVAEAERRVEDIAAGLYDDEFVSEINSNMKKEYEQRAAKRELKAAAKPAPPPRRVVEERRAPSQREMDRELHYYLSGFEKFPDHMKEKLKKMPGNRGFLWRGSMFYGHLKEQEPAERVVLTERVQLDGGFEIHEHIFTPTEHIIMRGGRRGRKEQIFYEQKRRIPTGME